MEASVNNMESCARPLPLSPSCSSVLFVFVAAKNVILAGVKAVTLQDTGACELSDLGANFYLTAADVGKNRAEACAARLQELNPAVAVTVVTSEISDDLCKKHQVSAKGKSDRWGRGKKKPSFVHFFIHYLFPAPPPLVESRHTASPPAIFPVLMASHHHLHFHDWCGVSNNTQRTKRRRTKDSTLQSDASLSKRKSAARSETRRIAKQKIHGGKRKKRKKKLTRTSPFFFLLLFSQLPPLGRRLWCARRYLWPRRRRWTPSAMRITSPSSAATCAESSARCSAILDLGSTCWTPTGGVAEHTRPRFRVSAFPRFHVSTFPRFNVSTHSSLFIHSLVPL